jgi:hypothetical protein
VNSSGFTTCGGLFPNYPGTVGWKSGFLLLKNQPLYQLVGGTPTSFVLGPNLPSLEEQCVNAGVNCVRRFDRNRKDIFRYAFFAHALGLERVDANGSPVKDVTGASQPKNTSGVADGGGVGGGDLMVTLGLWDQHVGSEFVQKSTLLHELGHTLGLRHGGGAPIDLSGQLVAQPNCKPNYLSIMNYLFQVRGLVGTTGTPTIDFSKQALGELNEGNLLENLSVQSGWNAMAYRTSWYAPLTNPQLALAIGPITRRCDGTPLTFGPAMVRVDGTSQTGAIDWNWDGDTLDGAITPTGIKLEGDINFNSALNNGSLGADGRPKLTFKGYNDFDHIDLRQVASRRNGGNARIDGGLSLDVGFGDVGFGDVGFGDVGFGDVGFGDVGFGDVGFGDVGFGDVGFGDVGFGDVGFGDVGFGDVGAPPGELDLDVAAGLNAPNSLTPTVLSNRIRLAWTAPHIGAVMNYVVYKVVGAAIAPASAVITLVTTPFDQLTVEDRDVKTKETYVYFVVARLVDGTLTAPSNFATVTK